MFTSPQRSATLFERGIFDFLFGKSVCFPKQMDRISLNMNTASLAQNMYGSTYIEDGEHAHFLMVMYTPPLSQGEFKVACAVMWVGGLGWKLRLMHGCSGCFPC